MMQLLQIELWRIKELQGKEDTISVYKFILADGERLNTSDVYLGGYSTYMYALTILNIPVLDENAITIYARGYVEMEDGTIVYGNARV